MGWKTPSKSQWYSRRISGSVNIVGALVEWQTHKRYSRGWISLMPWAWSNLGKKTGRLRSNIIQWAATSDLWDFVGEISIPHDPMVSWWLPSLKNCYFAFEHRRLKAQKLNESSSNHPFCSNTAARRFWIVPLAGTGMNNIAGLPVSC